MATVKLGFSTVSFLGAVPVRLEEKLRLLEFAAQNGLEWVEIRDSDVTLDAADCRALVREAGKAGLQLGYAVQKGLLDDDLTDVLSQALENAHILAEGGPGFFRLLGSNKEFSRDAGKTAWTEDEVDQAVVRAGAIAADATRRGVTLAVENAVEPLLPQGPGQLGYRDFLQRTGDEVRWQYDTANPFSASRVAATPADVRSMLEQFASRLGYAHIKSSVDNKPTRILTDNPTPFPVVFEVLGAAGAPYACIELDQDASYEACIENHKKSLDYLRSIGLF